MGVEDINDFEEITIDGRKEKIIIKINDNSVEDNNEFDFLEDTIELSEIIKDSDNNE